VPEHRPLRIYLDSNVLFSASLSERSRFDEFWRFREVKPVTSQYAIIEVARNLRVPTHRLRFEDLIKRTEIVSDADIRFIPAHIALAAKDRPILAAAIAARVDYLVTGDKNHFGLLYNSAVSGVHILSPEDFLALHRNRLTR
jgi:predicted nucleic acid-binding protein